eukprot:TRINITY_DN127801_c1_g1_i1.p2 TRINITY_DN127801_c1_g1~~TRINITY_DN127801_c1_g1_i1.p2  ORF type:complete len:114 (+),score=18.67 TRINITY_DN127801_c1_g1_i1:45-344(+)
MEAGAGDVLTKLSPSSLVYMEAGAGDVLTKLSPSSLVYMEAGAGDVLTKLPPSSLVYMEAGAGERLNQAATFLLSVHVAIHGGAVAPWYGNAPTPCTLR